MTSTFLSHTYTRRLTRGLILLSLCYVAFLVWRMLQLPGPEMPISSEGGKAVWPGVSMVNADYRHAFEVAAGRASTLSSDDSGLSERFRYAGAFMSLSDESQRTAVIDDLEKSVEHLIREGSSFEGMLLSRIENEFIELRVNGRIERLHRRGLEEKPSSTRSISDNTGGVSSSSPLALAPNRRFGNRVGRNHWVLSREKLMEYYQEVMADPERLVNIFDSMEPRYQPDGSIYGYQLNRKGEDAFFDAVGLSQGDAIEKVNNVKMSNRGRAEAFLRSFANNHASILLIDIERADGTTERVRYDIRQAGDNDE